MSTVTTLAPETFQDAAQALAAATAPRAHDPHRRRRDQARLGQRRPGSGSGAAHHWHLTAILEHNAGDLTASLQAGVPLALAQRTFAAAGQMLALDPPLSPHGAPSPTIGGVVATGDCGPLRHRYGAPRDLVVGVTVALSDGTIATAGGKVIKNVAGYDLAKLFAGSFGTLGLILSVNVRLHPLHDPSVTALGAATDPDRLAAAALALAAAPLEFEALDVAWRAGRGGLLARCAGPQAPRRARRAARLMEELGLAEVDVADADGQLWERQRAGQRSPDRALVRVAATPRRAGRRPRRRRGLRRDAGRPGGARAELRRGRPSVRSRAARRLPADAVAVLLDAPPPVRAEPDPWGAADGPALELMRRVKARFDPAGTCNPGLFVGGI